jgi:hypothetical protein
MRLDAQPAHRAARAKHLTDSMRFTVYRWIELLEPSNHFCVAASSWVDPLTGIRELRDAIQNIRSTEQASAGEVLARSEALRRILTLHARLNSWYPRQHQALIVALKAAEQGTPRGPRKGESRPKFEQRRRQVALARFLPILGTELADLEGGLLDPADGYLQRLLAEIQGWLIQAPSTFVDWRRLDHALKWLAVHAVEHGRDPHSLSASVLRAFERANSKEEATDNFVAVFGQPQRPHVVGIAVEGIGRIRRAEEFGCLPMSKQLSWPGGTPGQNSRLADFHEAARNRRGGPACVALVPCSAWDEGHARQQALARVAQLVDHVCAEHPATDIRLGRSILVLDVQSGEIMDPSPRLRSIRDARARKPQKLFSRSLRFYGLARQETVPVISILHTWIALEDLAAEAQRESKFGPKAQAPGAFLPPHASAAVALACTRAQLTSAFYALRALAKKAGEGAAWKEVELWLGVKAFGPPIPLPRWLQLIRAMPTSDTSDIEVPTHLNPDATQSVAAAYLWGLATRLGPFATFRIQELSRRLRNGGELSNWVSEIRTLAELHLVRMRFLRHAAVHRARHSDEAARQLAVASHDIADAVYEVLPFWLNDVDATWEGLRDARIHLGTLISAWASTSGHPDVDPERILQP